MKFFSTCVKKIISLFTDLIKKERILIPVTILVCSLITGIFIAWKFSDTTLSNLIAAILTGSAITGILFSFSRIGNIIIGPIIALGFAIGMELLSDLYYMGLVFCLGFCLGYYFYSLIRRLVLPPPVTIENLDLDRLFNEKR